MPIFQPTTPAYEHERKRVAHVENGCGPLGLWPRPVYLHDPRTPSCGGGAGYFGGLFTASQPGYTFSTTTALVASSEKTTKTRR